MRPRLVRRLLAGIVIAVALIVALGVGIWAGGNPTVLPGFVRNALVRDSEAQVYQEALDKISADYYRKVDRNHLLNTSIEAMVASLKDRFSHYIDPASYQAFEQNTNGEFEGVGMTVQEIPTGLEVMQVFSGGPAAGAGIVKGDSIVAVDGKSIAGRSSVESTGLIRGPAGTPVTLTVVHDGQRRELRLTRANVDVPVSTRRLIRHDGEQFGYVSLAQFTAGAHGEVGQNVRKLLQRGAKGIVLDLRNNGGGLLQEGVLVSSVFIPDGTIVSTRGRTQESRTYRASGDAIDTKVPLVVLVNRGTASASEIVTGALQDRHRATVVGTRTFGKGVFQEVMGLANGGALDITVGQYYTPSGRNLGPHDGSPGGITPDVRAVDNPKTPPDEALQKALDVLASK